MANNVKDIVKDAGDKAGELLNKVGETVTKAVDANGDGKFDVDDVKVAADSVGNVAKKTISDLMQKLEDGSKKVNEKIADAKKAADLRELRPVFKNDFDSPKFALSKLVRITDPDKRHLESKACEGSIGHYSKGADLEVVNIYRNSVNEYGLSFYPDCEGEIYYVDPADRDHYIMLDEYFKYLKISRINELQKIALDLGAKHFRVTYLERKADYDSVKGKAKVKAPAGTADAEHERTVNSSESIEIAAEMDCVGHAPVAPTVKYYSNDDNIQMLIASRMNGKGMMHQKYRLRLSSTSGIKEKDAAKIDAALGAMKCKGSVDLVNEAKRESNSLFEYEIDF